MPIYFTQIFRSKDNLILTSTVDNDALPSSGCSNRSTRDFEYITGSNLYNDDARKAPASVYYQYFWDFPNQISSNCTKEVAVYVSQMLEMLKKQNINIEQVKVGRGHRNPKIVSDCLLLSSYLLKLLDYEEKEEICGPNRNSYYKTDHDATAMCLKEDYYSGLGSNTHAAYNFQIIVSKGIILSFYVSQDRNDQYALIPAIEKFYELYNFYHKRL